MAKFYKPGRVVVVLNGKFAGKKGIIIKSNYENTKDKRYPHCLVVGLARDTKRVTKRFLKKVDDRTKRLEKSVSENKEGSESFTEQLQRLKRLGVFIKTYNMSHLLATRYKIDEDFGIQSNIEKLDKIESDVRDKQTNLNKKEHEKKDENKTEVEGLRKEIGGLKDRYRNTVREVKTSIGSELYNRFMRGFTKTRDNQEENEKITHAEFLFKKLKF